MSEAEATLRIQNIGGITQTEVAFSPGVTVLSGPNATNRSSLLDAFSAALGGSRAIPRSDGGDGDVRLALNGDEYSRHLTTTDNGQVHMEGAPLTEDADLIDLYVALDGQNPIRKAVEQAASTEEVSDSLREMLMTPVDDDAIRSELQQLQARRHEVVSELETIREQKERLVELEQRRDELQTELEQVEADLSAKREQMESMDVAKQQSEKAEALLNELEEAERTEQRIEDDLSHAEESLAVARKERDEVKAEVDQLAADLEEDTNTSAERLADLRREKNRLQDAVGVLMQIVRTSRELLEEAEVVPEELRTSEGESGDVLDGLRTEDSHVECWACGATVDEDTLEARLQDIVDLASSYRAEVREIDEQISTVKERAEERAQREERLDDLQTRLADRREAVTRYEQRIEEYREQLAEQRETVADLREQVEATEDLRDHEVLDVHDELRSLSREQGRLEREIESVEADITSIEARVEAEERLENERARLDTDIEELHGRIERLEKRAVTTLQTHLDTLINRLNYENIARIRVDRVISDEDSQARFEIAVVREGDNGVRQDPHGLRSLSESERALIGLLVAFAGHQTHDISDEIPFILVDSIEEFDAGRIATLINYIADEVEWVICALLPEDAGNLSHTTIDAEQLTAG